MNMPIVCMTGAQFVQLLKINAPQPSDKAEIQVTPKLGPRLIYGTQGLCKLLNCSPATIGRYKSQGVFCGAISQIGRKIVIDADKALECFQNYKEHHHRYSEG